MKLLRMIPDPETQPEAFDPAYPAEWMAKDIQSVKASLWLNVCNLVQCVFFHKAPEGVATTFPGKVHIPGATASFVTDLGTVTFDNMDMAVYWLMTMAEDYPPSGTHSP